MIIFWYAWYNSDSLASMCLSEHVWLCADVLCDEVDASLSLFVSASGHVVDHASWTDAIWLSISASSA